MKKAFLFLLAYSVIAFSALGQANDYQRCKFDEIELEMSRKDPHNYALHQLALQNAYDELKQNRPQSRSTPATASCPNGIRVIPIYMHVLHRDGNPNAIGDNNFTVDEINKAINRLNVYYQGTNPNLERAQDKFWAQDIVAANTCIQFCWNPADIHRVNMSNWPHWATAFKNGVIIDSMAFVISPLKSKCQYLNIYTTNVGITQFSAGGNLGHAYNIFTYASSVFMDDNIFVPGGAITNPVDSTGTTLAHEVGHYLGLGHIWGRQNISNWNTLSPTTFCNIDDGVDDTPLQGRPSAGTGLGVPSLIQNEEVIHCNTSSIMWTNFMDYTDNAWLVNFTKGQVALMQLYLKQAENLLPTAPQFCNSSLPFLKGETQCGFAAAGCASVLINLPHDTLRICHADTINLLQYIQNWTYNNRVSPTSEYTWRTGSLSGQRVMFPAKVPVYKTGFTCKPDTTEFFLNIKCATAGNEELGGKLVVIVYNKPEYLINRYLRNGDCQNGPSVVYPALDITHGCNNLITFTPVNPPAFPATTSGKVDYSVTFNSGIGGPCCGAPCVRQDSATYYCQVPVNSCPGVAVSGGLNMINLISCPDLDFTDLFNGYENAVSIFDPQNNINDFYFYSDVNRTKPFNTVTDFTYDGNGCDAGSDITIYTSLGCDTDHDGIPNTYITLGTISLRSVAPPPKAPKINYTINASNNCIYSIQKGCLLDNVTPSPLSMQTCGQSNLPAVNFSVLTDYDCIGNFTVAKPDCPSCPVANCASSVFNGGNTSVCSGTTLVNGLPDLTITGSTGPVTGLFWTTEPIANGGGQIYPNIVDDQPEWLGPVFTHSNLPSGVSETQTLYTYALCDDDNNPNTDPVYALLGQYVITVNPVPDARIAPVCVAGDSLNFYAEIKLHSNSAGNTFTATNDYDATTLTFSNPDTKLLGPFPNGSDVVVDFAIDGGCSLASTTLNTGCLQSSCTPPDVSFVKYCSPGNPNEYYVETGVTGNTTGYLFEVTNNINSDTSYIDLINHKQNIGPFPINNFVEITVTDYTHRWCFTSSGILSDTCLTTGIAGNEIASFIIYPNPASNTVTVSIEYTGEHADYAISVFDMMGKIVTLEKMMLQKGKNEIVIAVEQLSPGVYFVKAQSADKNSGRTGKFIKY